MKPLYRVPLMSEINALPWNGYTAVSTFSGGGGSSTGYKMAGFKLLWANEFIPAAQETYRANHPNTVLNTADIREVRGSDILSAINLDVGQLDLFDGSPPCASFSTAGKREAGWGKVKAYSDTKQRTDDLFFEYARLIREVQPKTFVAENVSGLIKGTAKGYFKLILQELKSCGYKVEARLLDAQWLGVPQSRQRLIFIGVRNDLPATPVYPEPLPYRYSVRDAIPDAVAHEYMGPGHVPGWASSDRPAYTISQMGNFSKKWSPFTLIRTESEERPFTIQELKRVGGFPDDYELTGSYAQQWERIGRAVPPVMMFHVAATIRDKVLPLCQ